MMNSETRYPVPLPGTALAFDSVPVVIDGMRVLFDKRVTLFPVTLQERPEAADRGDRNVGKA